MSTNKKKKSVAPLSNKSTSPESNLVTTSTYQSGPLPAPEQLNKYNQFIPGSGERIIKMAENGFNHRHEMEKAKIKITSEERQRGQWMAFVLGILGISGAVYLGLEGHSYPSIGIGLLGVIVITVQVIMGREKN